MMSDRSVLTPIEQTEDGLVVLAPLVGWWLGPPSAGHVLGSGSCVGMLKRLNARFELRLPHTAQGIVADSPDQSRIVPVEFGERLFRLVPQALERGRGPKDAAEATAMAVGQASAVVVAPTDGVFYRRPSPAARPYVEVGESVRRGQPIGLVEVMKTFNQIACEGPGVPETATVLDIRCEDGDAIRAGQVLIVLGS